MKKVLEGKKMEITLKNLLVWFYLQEENINPKKGCLALDEIKAYYHDDKALSKKKMLHLYGCTSCFTQYMRFKRDMETVK